jgi:plasmid stabilization system protein ParE
VPDLVWKAAASADLVAIIDFVADDNPDAASAPLDRIVVLRILHAAQSWP